ncbi:glycosyltransferase [Rhizobium lusitanum]|jgi:glycosyltransferase involved in cell wall biosynthesis/GT2 family glycosyltransferase|uniref:glycosyltransferase n=1 Tax=Rhizobium lusitanum TaxID=293958 RepID=UPI001571FEB7|nr:glycosyltransferase [Rhizobium lusitanum]NTJ11455.1 glycosyltransferase [Rhizobium lusitanum]
MTGKSRFAVLLSSIGDAASYYSTLASLGDQVFTEWHLFITSRLPENGWVDANFESLGLAGRVTVLTSNEASLAIPADWVLPLLPGDELTPDALARFAAMATANPESDMIYSDHAEFSLPEGESMPFFKPGWSPELLIATDYIGRAAVRTLQFERQVGSFNFDQIDLWEMYLSLSRKPNVHVERIERLLVSLVAGRPETLATDADKAVTVIANHLQQIGAVGTPRWANWAQRLSILSFEIDFPDIGPSITVLIPSRNNWRMLSRCVASLATTTYRNFQIVVVDNNSTERETLDYLKTTPVRVVNIPSPPSGFSYSYVNNEAVKGLNSDYVLFLNDDTEVISPRWLSQMAGWLQVDGVASVGARLLFPNDRIQHAGIVHKMLDGVLPGLPYRWVHKDIMAPRGQDRTPRNYSALTAACLLVRREEFISIGGFDDKDFSVAYNDCDLGFRFIAEGRRNVFEPTAELYHHEGVSRGSGRNNDRISEEIAFINKYRGWDDPYFNANLSLSGNGLQTIATRLLDNTLPEPRISLALFTHNLNYEGAPLVLLEIAEGLKSLCNAEITVFSPQDGPLRARYQAVGCRLEIVRSWPIYSSQTTTEFDRSIVEILDRLALSGADIVIANTILLHWAMIASQRLRLPAIWLIHESEPPFEHLLPHGTMHVDLAVDAMHNAAATVFVSRATKGLYDNYPKRYPAEVIYNGFDFALAQASQVTYDRNTERSKMGVSPDEIMILLPGTVCERKAQIELVSAIEQLAEDVTSRAKFFIVGAVDNEYTNRLYNAVGRLTDRKQARVNIVRATPDIFRYFTSADIMVFPSHLESFPRVVQEAMFFGLGIITTPVFGISEQIVDGKTALCFAPGDTKTLANHIEKLTRDPILRFTIGQQAKLSLDRFPSIDEMHREYWNLVKRVYQTEVGTQQSVSRNWVHNTTSGRSSWWEELIRG